MNKITLVDASGFIFRAFHAIPLLTTSTGIPTNAVLGFTRIVLKMLNERNPTHLAMCFDKDSRKGRLAIDPNYKANREETPIELHSQFGLIREVVKVFNQQILEYDGWEADDVIATICRIAGETGWEVEIITSDKDFIQLLAPHVTIFDPTKGKLIGEAEVLIKYGIKPSQMCDYLALVGDSTDNVPKVPGIGPKTAQTLLSKFNTVNNLLQHISEIDKPKIKDAIITNVDQLKMALELVTFRGDLPLNIPLESLIRKDIDKGKAKALFQELEFNQLLQSTGINNDK